MAFIPHTPDDVEAMLAAIGVAASKRCSTKSRPACE